MFFLVAGVALLLLKYLQIGFVADWSWWWVLSPFALAVVSASMAIGVTISEKVSPPFADHAPPVRMCTTPATVSST